MLSNMTTTENNSTYPSPCPIRDMKAFSQVFIPVLYTIVFITGLLGNGLVVCVLVKHRQNFNMTDICLFNLAISDLLFLFSLPFWAHYAAVDEWIFGSFMCHGVTSLYTLGFYGSIFFLVLMTVDRYTVIVHPQVSLFSTHSPFSVGITLALVMWALSLGASLPTMIFTKLNSQNGSNVSRCLVEFPKESVWRHVSYIEMNVLGWVLPLSVMAFCYSRIIPILRSMKSQKRHKAVRLILIIISIFFLFWTPYNIVIFMKFLQHLGYMLSCQWYLDLSMATQWVETIAFTHCCLNPIIYAFMGHKFRNVVLRMLKPWVLVSFRRETQPGTTSQREGSRSTRDFEVYTTNLL